MAEFIWPERVHQWVRPVARHVGTHVSLIAPGGPNGEDIEERYVVTAVDPDTGEVDLVIERMWNNGST